MINKHRPESPGAPFRAIGYRRVSTAGQQESGLGLDAQSVAIEDAVTSRGWTLAETATDAASGKSMRRRPELERALDLLDRGEADALVVSKLDRLSRSVPDAADILERARKHGWSLVVLDLGVDTSTSTGRLIAHVIVAIAQFEREQIGQRTKDALAEARKRGVRLGRESVIPAEVVDRIAVDRAAGLSYAAISNALNAERVPTGQGGASWWPATVRSVYLAAADRAVA